MALPPPPASHKRRRNMVCLCCIILALILIVPVILGFTVLKPKNPVTTINSMSLKDVKFIPSLSTVHLNLTFLVQLSIKNRNKVGSFKYTNGSALVKYRGQVVGDAPVPAGKISASRTSPLNLSMTVSADRMLQSNFSNAFNDILVSGTLPLTTLTRISGKVHIIKIFKIHVVSHITCAINVTVSNASIANWTCHSKI